MLHNHILETERLILRVPSLADADAIKAIVSHPDIAATTLNIPYPYPDDGVQTWLNRLESSEEMHYTFLVVRKEDNAVLGCVGIHPHERFKRAEIGYWLGVPYWGNGYTSEAARRLVQFGFEELDLVRIDAGYFTDNLASRRVMDKIGMQYEGTFRSYVQKGDVSKDTAFCAILREEWENGR